MSSICFSVEKLEKENKKGGMGCTLQDMHVPPVAAAIELDWAADSAQVGGESDAGCWCERAEMFATSFWHVNGFCIPY